MTERRTFAAMLKGAGERFRNEGFLSVLQQCLKLARIQISPFYYMREVLQPEIDPGLTVLPEGFEFSRFGFDEVTVISGLSERQGYVEPEYVVDNFNKGEICFGIKHRGEIVAFSWVSLEKSWSKLYRAAMKPNEAYLHDMYVLKAFRGKSLAPVLRYKTYEALGGMGRDTFYSVTEVFNASSLRFKQKLKAEFVFCGVYVELFSEKYHRRWVVKRYY